MKKEIFLESFARSNFDEESVIKAHNLDQILFGLVKK